MNKTLFLVVAFLGLVNAHIKVLYPQSRSTTGGTFSPCNGPSGEFITEVSPGKLKIILEEYIGHAGTPIRVALNFGEDDSLFFNGHVLLDHFPHDDETQKATYVVEVDIPNIDCDDCTLQIAQIWTDKAQQNCEGLYPENWLTHYTCSDVRITGDSDKYEWSKQYSYVPLPNFPTGSYGHETATFIDTKVETPEGDVFMARMLASDPVKVEKATDLGGYCPEPVQEKAVSDNEPTNDQPTNSIPTELLVGAGIAIGIAAIGLFAYSKKQSELPYYLTSTDDL